MLSQEKLLICHPFFAEAKVRTSRNMLMYETLWTKMKMNLIHIALAGASIALLSLVGFTRTNDEWVPINGLIRTEIFPGKMKRPI